MNRTGALRKDEDYIRKCIELAGKGHGFVSPNPLVGAVIVKDDRIIGEGWHKKYGDAHAEVEAFKNAQESVENATLYCNLEPCCHEKKQTPPCTPLIIQKKIRRVVIANIDPNPQVSGLGVNQLKAAGIEVVHGVLENEGKELNRFYFKHVTQKMPYVTVKIAQTLDAKIGLDRHSQTWISGEEAIHFVHRQRSRYDAVMVGANTVITDNPRLTVRHFKGRNPVRIVIDGNLTAPVQANLFCDAEARTMIFCSAKAAQMKEDAYRNKTTELIPLNADSRGILRLDHVLSELGRQGINSLFVEGGQELFSQFIGQYHFDEIIILVHPVLFGRGLESIRLSENIDVQLRSMETLGTDLKLEYRKVNNKDEPRGS
jgi:diaminohydroxyphosphoribosylaminopyrimidine deaminase/5-amino-6-(5-phosphoribosylamino)uracil reductase